MVNDIYAGGKDEAARSRLVATRLAAQPAVQRADAEGCAHVAVEPCFLYAVDGEPYCP